MPSAAEGRKAKEAKEQRSREFRAALALAGMTGVQFAEAHNVSFGHLWQVARGERESPPLEAEIERFIAKHLISRNALVA